MPKRTEDLVAWARAHGAEGPPEECWPWRGPLAPNGYGRSSLRIMRSRWAHRVVYEILVGPIPAGLTLDHLCRNRACVNPAHLQPVTHAENVRRGECGALNRAKTHCPKGHAYSGSNLYVEPSTGRRRCRICYSATQAAYKQRVRRSA